MEFDEYLKGKKIDSEKFKTAEPELFDSFKEIFDQVHPNSFTQQKLFLINKVRRQYPLKDLPEAKKASTPKMMKPKIKPLKPKTS